MRPSPLEKKPFSLIIATITAAMLFFAAFRCPSTDQYGPSVSASRPTATRPADPHDWPEWRAFRYQEAKLKTGCQWFGCNKDHTTKDLELHHGISVEWCLKSDHPELVYTKGKGQWFLWLCRDHHAVAHDICNGCGGAWSKFNPDSQADAAAGKWNSRGKSKWTFQTEDEVIRWVKDRVE
jgi:hypothetical protein